MNRSTRILLTGAGGLVGARILRVLLGDRRAEVHSTAGPNVVTVDLGTPGAAGALVRRIGPDVIIHAAAVSTVAAAAADPVRARRVNVDATREIAEAVEDRGGRMIFFSTDQIFDGRPGPIADDAEPAPLHLYGETKRDAESIVRETSKDHAILRLALVFGPSPSGSRSASETVIRAARSGGRLGLFVDEYRRPVSVDAVARTAAGLAFTSSHGTWNLAGRELVSRFEFGRMVCRAAGLDDGFIDPIPLDAWKQGPPRPRTLDLDGSKALKELGFEHPDLVSALRIHSPELSSG